MPPTHIPFDLPSIAQRLRAQGHDIGYSVIYRAAREGRIPEIVRGADGRYSAADESALPAIARRLGLVRTSDQSAA